MDAKLKVVGGSKAGVEIALKKAKFVIGRAPECSLRAGSDAISRRHCEIRLTRAEVSIRDLNSRNGTYVNGKPIAGEVVLNSGDEVGVGPLRFQVLVERGFDTRKRPEVKGIADAATRTAQKGHTGREEYEDNISEWLTEPASESQVISDTLSVRLDETNSLTYAGPSPQDEAPPTENDDDATNVEVIVDDPTSDQGKKGRKPGKLPDVPKSPSAKDSCEAAADVLRQIARRR
jgi:pSer/pThr/pTyr-binding forkhead associated (FHA) protein